MIRTKFDAQAALADCSHDVVFWLCDGTSLKSLAELRDALKTITEEAYLCHANEDRNDFANWIHDIFRDDALARELIGKRKSEAIAFLEERITFLKKKAK